MPGLFIGHQMLLSGSAWTKLIKDLNPIFWIEDTTVVVDGYLIDKSGNNKQIATSEAYFPNDTFTLPANDAAIIAALTADGLYDYFYTDDANPKATLFGSIPRLGSRRLYSYYGYTNFFLLADSPTLAQQEILYTKLAISKAYLPDVNIAKGVNKMNFLHADGLITGYVFDDAIDGILSSVNTFEDNVLSLAESDKKIVSELIDGVGGLIQPFIFQCNTSGGNYKCSFWFDLLDQGTGTIESSQDGVRLFIQPANTYKGYTWTSGIYSGEIKDIKGTWARIEYTWFAANNGDHNVANWNDVRHLMGLNSPTPVTKDLHYVDFILTKDYSETIVEGDIFTAPYEKTNSAIVGKTICTVGDSTMTGDTVASRLQYEYGLINSYNCAQGGRRMSNVAPNDFWQDRATVVAQPADIFFIIASANDAGATLGTIDDVDTTTYLGGYNQYLTYLLANIAPTAKVVLATCPFLVGTGNTVAQGKALYEQEYIDKANGVKALAVKHGVYCVDVHSLMPMNWDNCHLYLVDGVHYNMELKYAIAQIVGSYINNLYTYTAPVILPKIVSAIVSEASPTELVVTFSDTLVESSVPDTTDFSILNKTISSVDITGAVLTLTVSVAFNPADYGLLDYIKPVSDQLIRLSDSLDVSSFIGQPIKFDFAVVDDLEDGDTKFWLAGTDLVTITKNVNEVSEVKDKLRSIRTLTQDTATKYPIWSADGLTFDGSNDFIRGIFTYPQPASYYLLLKVVTWGSSKAIIDGGSSSSCVVQMINSSPHIRIWAGTELAEADIPLDEWFVLRIIINGANSSIQVNSNAALTGNAGNNPPAGITIGAFYNGTNAGNIVLKEGIFRTGLDSVGKITNFYNHLFNQI